VTQPPPYGSPQPYPTSGAPQQPDPWGPQQPASWGQPPQQPQPGVYGRPVQQEPQWGQQPQQEQWGHQQPAQDQWSQPPAQDQWGQPQQSPAPQWGQQPQQDQWGQQPPPAPYPPQRQGGTNGFAIASLIFGLLGGILLSVIFGFVALSQIKKRGQGGKGLAIAGLSLSGLWVLGIVAVVIVAVLSSGTDDPGSLADDGDVSVQKLVPGQCLNGLKDGSSISDLPAVACTEPHEGEVYAVFDLKDGGFPGDTEIAKLAEDGCTDRLQSEVPKAADDPDLEIYYLHPTRTSWTLGDHEVACVAMSSKGKVTGSIKD
jgi:putative regulator of septum formation/uncharacterized protein DUF4190